MMIQQIYPVPDHPYEYELNKDMHFAAAHYIPSCGGRKLSGGSWSYVLCQYYDWWRSTR